MVEGGACNHSRLQRCIRKSRSLQQRMRQQQQEVPQKARLPEQEEELQRRYQPISSSQLSAQPCCWLAWLGEELSQSCDYPPDPQVWVALNVLKRATEEELWLTSHSCCFLRVPPLHL